MRRIAFINEKGGTCKTTLCVNLGAFLAMKGKRVLIADLDTQGHAGKSLGLDVRALSPTIHDLLVDPSIALSAVEHPTAVSGLTVLPANRDLAGFPVAVAGRPDRADALRRRIDAIPAGRYDLVLFDAPPSQSLVTENVMRAATEVVIPVALTYLALDGCAEILETLSRLREERSDAPRVTLIVPALPRRTQLAGEIRAKLAERFPDLLARTTLGFSVKIDEAQSHGQTIFEYAPRSSGAAALSALAEELLERAPVAEGSVRAG
jgi:chromosome partitioning protein